MCLCVHLEQHFSSEPLRPLNSYKQQIMPIGIEGFVGSERPEITFFYCLIIHQRASPPQSYNAPECL